MEDKPTAIDSTNEKEEEFKSPLDHPDEMKHFKDVVSAYFHYQVRSSFN